MDRPTLHPESIIDNAGASALIGCPLWTQPVQTATGSLSGSVTVLTTTPAGMATVRILSGSLRVISRDSARRLGPRGQMYLDNGQLLACRLARVEASDQQLLEVMTDFWENHSHALGSTFAPLLVRHQ